MLRGDSIIPTRKRQDETNDVQNEIEKNRKNRRSRHHDDRHTHCEDDLTQSEHLLQKLMSLLVRSTCEMCSPANALRLLGPEPTSGAHLLCLFQPHVWHVQQKIALSIKIS